MGLGRPALGLGGRFRGGNLWLGGAPIGRYRKDVTNSGPSGVLSTDVLNAVTGGGGGTLPPALGGSIQAGSNWVFQYWFRDGGQSNFSSAISVTFCP